MDGFAPELNKHIAWNKKTLKLHEYLVLLKCQLNF